MKPNHTGIARFHAHLDRCSRCRNHPLDLCRVGQRLLEEAARLRNRPSEADGPSETKNEDACRHRREP